MQRVSVNPGMLAWARERAAFEYEDLIKRFPKIIEWEQGELSPTLKQLDRFAKAVYVPIGYLFLQQPPEEELPIPDFRTVENVQIKRPSPNLLDAIYACQQRQEWFREFAHVNKLEECDFVGSLSVRECPAKAAEKIAKYIGFSIDERASCRNHEEALRYFVNCVDHSGVLVMVSGIVNSNTRRRLDVSEFRGFALADNIAPLIFVNGADSKSAQAFTLAHELAHIWISSTGLSNYMQQQSASSDKREEVWCNAVAAELLAPTEVLKAKLSTDVSLDKTIAELRKFFKVSSLVLLIRLREVGYIDQKTFANEWRKETAKLQQIKDNSKPGGDFYRATASRLGKRFARAVIGDALEGQTLYRDAFEVLGVKKINSFNELGREVGVIT